MANNRFLPRSHCHSGSLVAVFSRLTHLSEAKNEALRACLTKRIPWSLAGRGVRWGGVQSYTGSAWRSRPSEVMTPALLADSLARMLRSLARVKRDKRNWAVHMTILTHSVVGPCSLLRCCVRDLFRHP